MLIEKNWADKIDFGNGISIITETSHHGSGRALGGGQNLWVSFILVEFSISPDLSFLDSFFTKI